MAHSKSIFFSILLFIGVFSSVKSENTTDNGDLFMNMTGPLLNCSEVELLAFSLAASTILASQDYLTCNQKMRENQNPSMEEICNQDECMRFVEKLTELNVPACLNGTEMDMSLMFKELKQNITQHCGTEDRENGGNQPHGTMNVIMISLFSFMLLVFSLGF